MAGFGILLEGGGGITGCVGPEGIWDDFGFGTHDCWLLFTTSLPLRLYGFSALTTSWRCKMGEDRLQVWRTRRNDSYMRPSITPDSI